MTWLINRPYDEKLDLNVQSAYKTIRWENPDSFHTYNLEFLAALIKEKTKIIISLHILNKMTPEKISLILKKLDEK